MPVFFLLACGTTNPEVFDVIGTVADKVVLEVPTEDTNNNPIETHPSKLDVVHLSTMRLEGSDLLLESVLNDNSSYTRYSISYIGNTLKLTGIMNIPKGDGPFPLLILNHGYIDPAVYTNGRGLKREQDYFARRGFAVIHPDYRGHAGSDPSPIGDDVYDASLEYSMDVMNAILAVKDANLPTVSTEKIGMLGHSMGGGVTLNIATARADLIDAVVLYAPVHADAWQNFTRWRDDEDGNTKTRDVLGSRETNPKNWDKLSAQTYFKNIDDPILNFHGTSDDDVPLSWSEDLANNLNAQNKVNRLVIYKNEEHEFGRDWPDFMAQSTEHFKKHLTPKLSTL